MTESQSSLPDKARKIRKLVAAVFLGLTLASLAVPVEADTYLVFLFIPTLLLIFARRLHVALAIEFSALALWITRRLFLEGPPPEKGDFFYVYLGTLVGLLFAFQLSDFIAAWWRRKLNGAGDPAADSSMLAADEGLPTTPVLLTFALFFVLSSWGIAYADLYNDTLLVFGLAPAALCAMAALGLLRLRTILVIELVLVAIWLVRVLYFTEFEPGHVTLFSVLYYVAIAATLIAVKLFDAGVNAWKRSTSCGDAKLSA